MTLHSNTCVALTLAGVLSISLLASAYADGGRMLPRQVLPAYRQECGSCHVAYPAGLLPASSWRRIMSGLSQHYGSDAALDAQTTQQIGAWLQAHAGSRAGYGQAPAQDRITRSTWFERKHRKIDPAVWRHTSVKSAANCTACHADAALGGFDDDRLRIPPGLDKRYLRAFQDD